MPLIVRILKERRRAGRERKRERVHCDSSKLAVERETRDRNLPREEAEEGSYREVFRAMGHLRDACFGCDRRTSTCVPYQRWTRRGSRTREITTMMSRRSRLRDIATDRSHVIASRATRRSLRAVKRARKSGALARSKGGAASN